MHSKEIILNSLLILAITTVVVVPWIIKAKERRRVHDTLARVIEQGITPSAELLRALVESVQPRTAPVPEAQRDLRKGVLWVSVALGLAALLVAIIAGHDPSYVYFPLKQRGAALGVAAFPAAVGIGYLVLWLAARNRTE